MIWLIDISRLIENLHLETPTGIDRVEMAYAQHFLAREGDVRFVLTWPHFAGVLSREEVRPLLDDAAQRWSMKRHSTRESFDQLRAMLEAPFAKGAGHRAAALGAPDEKRSNAARLRLTKLWLRSAACRLSGRHIAEFRKEGARYVHVSQFRLNRPRRFTWLDDAQAKSLFMLHDLIPILYPEYCRPGEALRHRARLDTMVRHASMIVANSHYTRSMLEQHLTAENRAVPPCEVVPLGLPPSVSEAAAYRDVTVGIPYFVVIGTIEPRKNILFLLSVWHRWTQAGRDPRARLVVVGRRGWENENVVDLLERSAGLAPSVIEVSSLSDAGMVSLLRGAAALIAPSFVEGFGLPVAEALALGVPVLASDIAAHREVGGTFADYVHPLDGPGWMQAFDDYSDPKSARRQARIAALNAYTPMTWQRHMAQVETLFASIEGK